MECGGDSCRASSSGACSSTQSSRPQRSQSKICCKCKELQAQILANQTEPLCASCLNASLFSKFKTAINTNELVVPTDKVLLAFSGGPASRVALEFLLEIREKALRDASYCTNGSILVFGLGVVHVDEGLVLPVGSFDPEVVIEELKEVVMNAKRKPDEFLVVPLESIYTEGECAAIGAHGASNSRKKMLQLLMQNVADTTGKEDLLEHLRMQVLQQVAEAHGYTKLVSALSTSRISAKVIAAIAKGRGFALPAELQYLDARWNVPIVLPLRDCIIKELILLCHFRHLKTIFIPTFSTFSMLQSNINFLSAAFVSLIQEDNPSRERTIMRTAAKLQPFSFNHLLSNGTSNLTRSSSVPSSHVVFFPEDQRPEPLCRICQAPLNINDVLGLSSSSENLALALPISSFIKMCCPSCQFQIFGGKCNEVQEFLPHSIKRRETNHFKDSEV